VTTAATGQTVGIVLDRSPFYGEAGGQIGDAGTFAGPRGAADVEQTVWVDEVLVHHAVVREGTLSVQETVRAAVDPERRLKVARSHTAAHMLHWALRKVLGPDTVQAGSFVEPERVRFDFSALQGLRDEQRHQVEALVNSRVRLVDEVRASQMPLEEARRAGALALFGEKYGNTVRVVTIGDYSKELCGGTHLLHTGFVGTFLITGESSIAAGTRRIEALVGGAAAQQQYQQQRLLHEVAKRLGRPAQEVVAGLEELLEALKRSERERRSLQQELAKVEANRLVAQAKKINGVTFVMSTIKQADRELLATLADAVKSSLQRDGVVLLVSSDGPAHVSLVMATTSDLTQRVHAGHLLKAISPLTKGSGGGRPEFAQAGGRDPSGIPAALKRAEELVREALEK
jgi:alanyl-tRNA synthetase